MTITGIGNYHGYWKQTLLHSFHILHLKIHVIQYTSGQKIVFFSFIISPMFQYLVFVAKYVAWPFGSISGIIIGSLDAKSRLGIHGTPCQVYPVCQSQVCDRCSDPTVPTQHGS